MPAIRVHTLTTARKLGNGDAATTELAREATVNSIYKVYSSLVLTYEKGTLCV
jgi:hypothetical protein